MDAPIPHPGTLENYNHLVPIGPYDIGTLDVNGRRKYVLVVEKDWPENRTIFNSVVQGNLEEHGYLESFYSEDDNIEEDIGKTAIFALRLNDTEFEEMRNDPKIISIQEAKILEPQKMRTGIEVQLPQ